MAVSRMHLTTGAQSIQSSLSSLIVGHGHIRLLTSIFLQVVMVLTQKICDSRSNMIQVSKKDGLAKIIINIQT